MATTLFGDKSVGSEEKPKTNTTMFGDSATPKLKDTKKDLPKDTKKIEDDQEDTNWFVSSISGIASGVLKIPEGFVSLGAELIDLGFDTNNAAKVEEFFDNLNIFEEYAEDTLTGKILEGIIQFGIPGIGGYKLGASAGRALAKKLSKKALDAKKAGKAVGKGNLKNVSATTLKRNKINKLKKESFANKMIAGAGGITGSALGEAGAYQQDLDTILGDTLGFEALKTDKGVEEGRGEASRRLFNRAKFAIESGLIGAGITGAFTGLTKAAKTGGKAAFSSDPVERIFGKIVNGLTPQGPVSKRFFVEQRAAKDAIEGAKEIATESSFVLEEVAKRIVNSGKKSKLFQKLDRPKFDQLKKLLQDRLESFGDAKLVSGADNIFEYTTKGNAKATAAKKALDDFLKKNNVSKDLLKELDDSMYGARNQIDVFSSKIKELAAKRIAAATKVLNDPNATNQAIKNAKDVIKEADNLTKAISKNMGTYFTLEYDLIKNSNKGLFSKAMLKYKPTEEAIKQAEDFFIPRLRAKRLAQLKKIVREEEKAKVFKNATNKVKAENDIVSKAFDDRVNELARARLNSASVQGEILDEAADTVNFLIEQSGKNLDAISGVNKNVLKNLEEAGLDIDKSILKQRKLPQELKALYGEVRDPFYNIANTISKQAEFIAKFESYDNLLKVSKNSKGQNTVFFDKDELVQVANRLGINAEKQLVEIKTTGPLKTALDGKFTFKEVAEVLNEQGELIGKNWYNDLYTYMVLYPKSFSNQAKTIFSPFTHVRNFVSAALFTTMNGNILFQNPMTTAKYFKQAYGDLMNRNSVEAVRNRIKHTRLGIRGTNPIAGETEKLAKESGLDLINKNYGGFLGKTIGGILQKVGKKFRDAYLWEDNIWKGLNFEAERDAIIKNMDNFRLGKGQDVKITSKNITDPKFIQKIEKVIGRKIGAYNDKGVFDVLNDPLFRKNIVSPRQTKLGSGAYRDLVSSNAVPDNELVDTFADNFAAEITKNNIPNYEYVGSAIKSLRRLPFGTFVAFPAEILRTGFNTIQRGVREATTEGFRATGLRRLAGSLTTAAVVPAGLVELGKTLADATDKDIQALRRIVAPWERNGVLMPISRDENGQLNYTNLSYIFPYDTLIRPVTTMFNEVAKGQATDESINQSLFNAGVVSMSELFQPFISESIFSEALIDISLRNGVDNTGRRIWDNENDSIGDKLYKGAMHVAETLTPGSLSQAGRIKDALFNKPDDRGRVYDLGKELPGIFGFRVQKSQPDKAFPYMVTDFLNKERDAKAILTKDLLKGGLISPAEIIQKYIDAEQARFKLFQDFRENVKAVETLDISKQKLYTQLDRVPKTMKNAILSDKYVPFLPTKNQINAFLEKYKDLAKELGRPIDPSIYQAYNKIIELYSKNVGKSMNDDLDFEIVIPESFKIKETPSYKQEEQGVTPKQTEPSFVAPEFRDSTSGKVDDRFRSGTLTDPTERLIAGVD